MSETPDMMLEALQNAGYRFSMVHVSEIPPHGRVVYTFTAFSPDGWIYQDSEAESLILARHSVIQKAYAHMQAALQLRFERDELEKALREQNAKIAELQAKLEDCEHGWDMIGY